MLFKNVAIYLFMNSFEIILIDVNEFDENKLVSQDEPNFTKDNYINYLNLKTNYLNLEKSCKLISEYCEVKKVENAEEFMTESVKFMGADERMINVKDCYEFKDDKEYIYQVMFKMPNTDDNLNKLDYNILASSLTFDKELIYGKAVLFKTQISEDNLDGDQNTSCNLKDILGLLMNNKYHTGVYINNNKFTDIFFDNTYKIIDPFNKWRNDCNMPNILSDSKYGTVDKTYFDFKLKIAYDSSSEDSVNEPLTRLGQGFVKGHGIVISPYNENSFYEIRKEDLINLLKIHDKLRNEDRFESTKKTYTKYQLLNRNL
tara:strand:+ start:3339 stop:4286 length:948 start_codon:yes stop_codon:yes gene_type:complete